MVYGGNVQRDSILYNTSLNTSFYVCVISHRTSKVHQSHNRTRCSDYFTHLVAFVAIRWCDIDAATVVL